MNNRHRRIKKLKGKKVKYLFLKKGAKGYHKLMTIKSFGEIIDIHSQTKKWFIGNLAQPYGMLMIDIKFRKKDCIQLSPQETKRVFLKHPYHDENDYKYWFGEDAV
ncbi:hypothetical protein IGI37_000082 [Enterococcus sp. AZ194]|uniref:hypothetical protein n=1 Tax=Enterococcus sp. AZ194 TaxID=2774629 RepID=UPI003F27CA49